MSKILITGASGLIGTRLTEMLIQQGHQVIHLGRNKKSGGVPTFVWNVKKDGIDAAAFQNVDTVVHLAGAGVSDHRWTPKWKQEILESRTESTVLLARYLEKFPQVKTVVAASAIGYYGFGVGDQEFTESSQPGSDFLAQVVRSWEMEVDKIQSKRVVKLRIGIVLSEKGGALKKMMTPIQWGIGAALGTGRQYTSWIHIDDLCRMFIHAIENSTMQGAYNATGPYAVTNTALTKAIGDILHKPLWLPPVPSFVLKIIVGEMAEIVVTGSNVSSKKIQDTGFLFQFPDLKKRLSIS